MVTETKEKRPSVETFPWERRPDESIQAYARFVAYRNTDPSERSIRKLGISMQLAARWSKRHQWVRRTQAFDDWQLGLSDDLAKHAVLSSRRQLARLGSAALSKANESVLKLNAAKQNVGDIVGLTKVGVSSIERAFGQLNETKPTGPAVVVQTAVSYGDRTPGWLANSNEVKQNEVVVKSSEQVLGEGNGSVPRTGQGKVAAPDKLLPAPRKRLKQLVVAAPVRYEED